MGKMDYKKTFLLGFGFFAISVTWGVYNSFVQVILKNFKMTNTLIGFIMTIDNYLAIFIQPAVGIWSDRIDTKIGKRMPFIVIGMPIAAVFLFLLPNYTNFTTFMIFLIILNLSMSIFRSPVISLMPDVTYKENRSRANSIINFMGGIGSIMAYLFGSILWGKNPAYPFYMAAVLMIISMVVLFSFIKEKRDVIGYEESKDNKGNALKNFKEGIKNSDNPKNIIYLLLAICSWFIAYQGIEAHFTNYGVNYLKVSVVTASQSFLFISLSFLIFAIPAGIIGTKIGKKKTIITGVIGLVITFAILSFMKDILTLRIVFVFCGIFWALININSYPLVTDMAPKGYIGAYTGLYYFASSVAAIISPVALGAIIDKFTYKYCFAYGTVFFILALVFILQIKEKRVQESCESKTLR